MTDTMHIDDVEQLVATTRHLVGQAHRLSRSINEAMEELVEFTSELRHDRRVSQQPYRGVDRRGYG